MVTNHLNSFSCVNISHSKQVRASDWLCPGSYQQSLFDHNRSLCSFNLSDLTSNLKLTLFDLLLVNMREVNVKKRKFSQKQLNNEVQLCLKECITPPPTATSCVCFKTPDD